MKLYFKKKLIHSISLPALIISLLGGLFPGNYAAANSSQLTDANNTSFPQIQLESRGNKIDSELLSQFEEGEYQKYLVMLQIQTDTEAIAEQSSNLSMLRGEGREQAQLSARKYILNSLQTTADGSQEQLIELLEAEQEQGNVKSYESFFISNVLFVHSTKDVLEKLAASPLVYKIYPNEQFKLDYTRIDDGVSMQAEEKEQEGVPWNIKNIGADLVWDQGIDGRSVVVANMDSGVDATHPALSNSWLGSGQANTKAYWYDAFGGGSTVPHDGDGHGTHTMGTMVGREGSGLNRIGVAPGAKWIATRIFDDTGATETAVILRGAQWILAPDGKPGNAPDIVNNSWGSGPGKNEFLRQIVQNWRAAGIFPVFSGGNTSRTNNGGAGSVTSPGNYPEAFAVGAIDENDILGDFSLWGPSPYNEVKPDISAPGVKVRSSVPGSRYEENAGTSMAAPHVAGAAALLKQANPSITVDQIEQTLVSTANGLIDDDFPLSPNNGYGAGRVNAYLAVQSVMNGELGIIKGKITAAGVDEVVPIIEHTPSQMIYNVVDHSISAKLSDEFGVADPVLLYRTGVGEEFKRLNMTLVSGSKLSGIYEGIIPRTDLQADRLEYQIQAVDHAGNLQQTSLYEVQISSGITLGYHQDFETSIDGFEFGGKDSKVWQWGEPVTGPAAFSGSKVIGTNLNGHYGGGVESQLILPVIDLRNNADVVLSYKHWYDLHVWAASDTAEIWIGEVPASGQVADIQFQLAKLYTFSQRQWSQDFIDLKPYLGKQVFVIFHLRSDFLSTGAAEGWYLDDIALESPSADIPAVPEQVSMRFNTGRITFSIPFTDDSNIKEYVLYRSETGAEGSFEEVAAGKKDSRYTSYVSDTPLPSRGTYYYYLKSRSYGDVMSLPTSIMSWSFSDGDQIYLETFEAGDGGWTTEGDGSDWEYGELVPATSYGDPRPTENQSKTKNQGFNLWATRINGFRTPNVESSLISPLIDLSAHKNVTIYYQNWFDVWWDEEEGYLEGRVANGPWGIIERRMHDTDQSPRSWWSTHSIELPEEYLSKDVQFRFRYKSNNDAMSGWYLDDFEIRGTRNDTGTGTLENFEMNNEEADHLALLEQTAGRGITFKRAAEQVQGEMELLQSGTVPVEARISILETGQSVKSEAGSGEYVLKHPQGTYTIEIKAPGYQTVVQKIVIASGEQKTLNVEMQSDESVSLLSIESAPKRTVYTEGERLDLDGLSVLLDKRDGSPEVVTFADFASRGLITSPVHRAVLKPAHTRISIIHEADNQSVQQSITVHPVVAPPVVVTELSIKNAPKKTAYKAGEKLSLEGLIIAMHKSDGSSESVAFADFASRGLTTRPAHGAVLNAAHTQVSIIYAENNQAVQQKITVVADDSNNGGPSPTPSQPANPIIVPSTPKIDNSRENDSENDKSTRVVVKGQLTPEGVVTAIPNLQELKNAIRQAKLLSGKGEYITTTIDLVPDAGQKQPVGLSIEFPMEALIDLAELPFVDLQVKSGAVSIQLNNNVITELTRKGNSVVTLELLPVASIQGKSGLEEVKGYKLHMMVDHLPIDQPFTSAIQIGLPYHKQPNMLTESIVAIFDTESKQNPVIRSSYSEEEGKVDLDAYSPGNYVVAYHSASFHDVSRQAWYGKAVYFSAARGILYGTADETFSPDEAVTRGQFITMMMRAYEIAPEPQGTSNFADAGDTYYTGYLSAAKKLGIARGTDDNRYEPDQTLSRQDMMVLLYRMLDMNNELPKPVSSSVENNFKDSHSVADYAKDAVNTLFERGVISGYNGRVNPQMSSTRAEIAQLIFNLLEKQ